MSIKDIEETNVKCWKYNKKFGNKGVIIDLLEKINEKREK